MLGKRLGIASFVLSFFFGLLGIVLGAVGIAQSKKFGHKNNFAVAGITIGTFTTIILFIYCLSPSLITNLIAPINSFLNFYPAPLTINDMNDDSFPINVLDKLNISRANFDVEGSIAACQPNSFDPSNVPVERKELVSNYSILIYSYICASEKSYVIEIQKDEKQHSRYTHVVEYSYSDDGRSLFLANNTKDEDGWKLIRRIADIETNTDHYIPDLNCVANNYSLWQADRMVSYSESGSSINSTSICVWDRAANLISTVQTNNYWAAASKNYLAEQIGLLTNEPDIFYTYTTSNKSMCSLLLVDITDPAKRKSIDVLDRTDYQSLHCGLPEVKFDFSDMYFKSGTLEYRIEENKQNGVINWSKPKTIFNN